MPTKIEWCEETISPLPGCSKISEGCKNCWAVRMANRFKGQPKYNGLVENGNWTGRVNWWPADLDKPLHWKKPRLIFVNSMGDIFHPNVRTEWIKKIFSEIAMSSFHKEGHTFILLTKRPGRLLQDDFEEDADPANGDYSSDVAPLYEHLPWPKNLWFGVTAENQKRADERIPILLQIPAAVRWVSVEPMLGPIILPKVQVYRNDILAHQSWPEKIPLDWVVCGGESGPGARPMHPDWVRSLRDQCVEAGVPFLFKQWGEFIPADQMSPSWASALNETRGSWFDLSGSKRKRDFSSDEMPFAKVGKSNSGRKLDGRTWDQYPIIC